MNISSSKPTTVCLRCSAPPQEVSGNMSRDRSQLGQPLAQGGNKVAFEYNAGVIGVLKFGNRNVIVEELDMLAELAAHTLPTPTVSGPVHITGLAEKDVTLAGDWCRPGIEFDERFAHGSKQVVSIIKGKVVSSKQPFSISSGSLPSLTEIRKLLVDKKMAIHDLQFLVRKDGSVVIADPLKVIQGQKPSRTNLQILDKLIEVARARP